MADPAEQKRMLLAQIDQRLDEAFSLPKTRESWSRREEIDLEILLLCRRIGDLSHGPMPYWAGDGDGRPDAGGADASRQTILTRQHP